MEFLVILFHLDLSRKSITPLVLDNLIICYLGKKRVKVN